MTYFFIGLGGALGASLRYYFSSYFSQFILFSVPLGTILVNLLGCFLIGYFISNQEEGNTFFINNFPEHERVPVSLYKLGLISIKLEKNDEAIAFFERVILNYPESGSSILSEQELLKFKS